MVIGNLRTKINKIPRFYTPRPYQVEAWKRRDIERPDVYIKNDCRQSGKDTDDLQYLLMKAWENPGSISTYIGIDNKWIRRNIFEKRIDNMTHWKAFGSELVDPKDSKLEVQMKNGNELVEESKIKFLGFANETAPIGSSDNFWVISEASLYPRDAFSYLEPIWNSKAKSDDPFMLCINGKPRGLDNTY